MFSSIYNTSLRYNFEEQYETPFLKLKHGDLFHGVLLCGVAGALASSPKRKYGDFRVKQSFPRSSAPGITSYHSPSTFLFLFLSRGRVQFWPLFLRTCGLPRRFGSGGRRLCSVLPCCNNAFQPHRGQMMQENQLVY